jgi:adenosylcobinamide kinase/adenosylcobinamide-phosphate guanylyltransferase
MRRSGLEPARSARFPVTGYRRILVLGGARSGKSRYARDLAETSGLERWFVATAQAADDEMHERIDRHRSERDPAWRTQEVPLALAEAVARHTAPERVVLVDCLTLWLTNVILSEHDPEAACETLIEAIARAAGPLILVSNEVGQGIVPATALGRGFRDAHGRLNQQVAAACDAVVLVAAGCPTLIKPAPAFSISLA